jgi:general secretion pathway protein I
MTSERPHRPAGFTLVEVLVALAIIAFGLVAVFGQLSQSASAAARLRDKTLAHWVAVDRLTELRLSGAFPGEGISSDDVEMGNTRWHYEIKVSATDTDDLRRADVSVAFADSPARPLAKVTGFLAERRAVAPPPGGWPVVTPDGELIGEGGKQDEKEPPPAGPANANADGGNDTGGADSAPPPADAQPQ